MNLRARHAAEDYRIPSVSWLQRLHLHFIPPATQVHHGLMYPLHRAHLGGPDGPVSTSGMGSSRWSWSAKGCIIAAMGISQSDARREVLGTFQVDMRTNFGEELPGQAYISNASQLI